MALNWLWSEKCGEATLKQGDKEFALSLYTGNAFLIMLNEYEQDGEEMYSMFSFWVDEQHMKNMLGLNKKGGYTENHYAEGWSHLTKFRLSKQKCRNINKIVPALVKAFDNIDIEIYSEEV